MYYVPQYHMLIVHISVEWSGVERESLYQDNGTKKCYQSDFFVILSQFRI